jgi:hypothetical protein
MLMLIFNFLKLNLGLIFFLAPLFLTQSIHAAETYSVSINIDGIGTSQQSYNNVLTAFDSFKESQIKQVFPLYDNTQAVSLSLTGQGVAINYAFLVANNNTLTIKIPAVGLNRTFTGSTRKESRDLAINFLRSNGYLAQILEVINKNAIAKSVTDPIAGNPNSMLANMVENDFNQQFLWRISSQKPEQSGVGAGYRLLVQDDQGEKVKSQSFTPFFRVKFDDSLLSDIAVSMPLSLIESETTQFKQAGLAISARKIVNDAWIISSGGSYSIGGSEEDAKLAQYGGLSIGSDYHWKAAGWQFAFGNMVGHYKTFKIAGYDVNMANTAYRNAFVLSKTLEFRGNPYFWDTFLIDTRYSGTPLAVSNYQEIGVGLRGKTLNLNWRATASVIHGASNSTYFSIVLN